MRQTLQGVNWPTLAVLGVGLVALAVTHEPARRAAHDGSEHGSVVGRVVRAVDGDTAVVWVGGRLETVRYIGLDTPESVKPGTPVQCFAHEASQHNAKLVEGKRVRLSFGAERRDIYGRLLAYVHRGDLFVNALLLAGGYARTLEIAPNVDHAALFARLQARAEEKGLGLWSEC
ncbi:thermonuclease family protein [soil metagenome]